MNPTYAFYATHNFIEAYHISSEIFPLRAKKSLPAQLLPVEKASYLLTLVIFFLNSFLFPFRIRRKNTQCSNGLQNRLELSVPSCSVFVTCSERQRSSHMETTFCLNFLAFSYLLFYTMAKDAIVNGQSCCRSSVRP